MNLRLEVSLGHEDFSRADRRNNQIHVGLWSLRACEELPAVGDLF